MSAFEYTVLDASGRERRGVAEADTARQVRQQLRDQGLIPLSVQEAAGRERARAGPGVRRGIGAAQLALITRQLATLLRSGMPLEEVIGTVARQTTKTRVHRMLLAVRARVLEGHTLADGLAQFPHVFPDIYRATVAAGEQSGHLEAVLERLADYTESRQQTQQKMMLALLYPAILTVIAVAVTIALLTYVVPQVVQVFSNLGQQLPLLTRMLIALSAFLRAWGLWLLLLLAAAAVAAGYALRRPEMRARFHRLLLHLPLIGRLTQGVNTARFARTFSILSGSGVPVLEAMAIAAEVMTNLPMRAAVQEAADRVREGTGLFAALDRSGLFPPMTLHLIASGEATGRLEEMLERAAVNQERELETLVAALMGVFEPLLILTMGGIVLVIVLAILLPIFDLNQLVR